MALLLVVALAASSQSATIALLTICPPVHPSARPSSHPSKMHFWHRRYSKNHWTDLREGCLEIIVWQVSTYWLSKSSSEAKGANCPHEVGSAPGGAILGGLPFVASKVCKPQFLVWIWSPLKAQSHWGYDRLLTTYDLNGRWPPKTIGYHGHTKKCFSDTHCGRRLV